MRDLIRDALEHLPRGECPEAERLAAYADRRLDRVERSAIDAHLASCGRCREMLILIGRAEQAEASAGAGVGRARGVSGLLRRWPWLAGAAAACLALVMWAAVQQRQPVPQAVPSPAAVAVPGPQEIARPDARVSARAEAAREQDARPPAAPSREKRQPPAVDRLERKAATKQDAGPKPPPTAPGPSPVPTPPAAVAETVTTTAAKPTPSQATGQDTASLRAEAYLRVGRATELVTAAPDGRTLWRVSAAGAVERSSDAGVTWTRDPDVEAAGARAISSPSADVCWVVGDAGLILRHAPAGGWTRVRAPVAAPFVGVAAVDARQATVTASDGRRFSTADGGETWARFDQVR